MIDRDQISKAMRSIGALGTRVFEPISQKADLIIQSSARIKMCLARDRYVPSRAKNAVAPGCGDASYTVRARRSASRAANFAGSSGISPSARRAVP